MAAECRLRLGAVHHGVHLRREGDYLYLASIADSMRRPGQVIQGEIPASVTPDQIVTITASSSGLSNGMSSLTVKDNDVDHFALAEEPLA